MRAGSGNNQGKKYCFNRNETNIISITVNPNSQLQHSQRRTQTSKTGYLCCSVKLQPSKPQFTRKKGTHKNNIEKIQKPKKIQM